MTRDEIVPILEKMYPDFEFNKCPNSPDLLFKSKDISKEYIFFSGIPVHEMSGRISHEHLCDYDGYLSNGASVLR